MGMLDCPDFTDFRKPENPHDRVILVEGVRFYVYYGLLASWSEFFRGVGNPAFKESKSEEIVLDEVKADHFHDFLHLISPDDFEITEDNYQSLIRISYRFLAPRALKMCARFINANFESMNKIKLLDIASEHELKIAQNVSTSIGGSLAAVDILDLLQVVFKHDNDYLKQEVSQMIAANTGTITIDRCVQENCQHVTVAGTPCPCGAEFQRSEECLMIPKRSFLLEQRDRILSLSTEIQLFLLNCILFSDTKPEVPLFVEEVVIAEVAYVVEVVEPTE